jgi:hypothetical protein
MYIGQRGGQVIVTKRDDKAKNSFRYIYRYVLRILGMLVCSKAEGGSDLMLVQNERSRRLATNPSTSVE